ncbi:hypothetical protein NQ314_015506 [Rhamnusium bicolor]|uniref:glycerol kinase n=1 Tax=Rhamnusium bicolor TaxID=1586634 RepID=A0AAV8WY97_9CUCU|nr:hypothetical protein NQ314_015506 [Rhamnusium bicolor]
MTDTRTKYGPLIGSIDEGTSSTRFLVFASKTAEVLTYHQVEVPHIIPQEGWFEQDPMIILKSVIETIDVTCDNLKKLNINYEDIVATGITNQRETTILWDPTTGKPLYNALVWMDMRTSSTVDMILQNGSRPQNFLQNLCGLPVSTYFSALKVRWMMDNVEGVREAMEEGRCLFGNVDTWLVWVIKQLLYGRFFGNAETRYGLEHEAIAIEDFQELTGFQVETCGIFIGKQDECFLGASPDGIIKEENVIIEVKCPEKVKKISIEEAVNNKIIDFLKFDEDGTLRLKTNHNYHYQIQGQLHITDSRCGLHITDVTNASRTMLMNIETLKWDPWLCKVFDIPMNILPKIRSCSEIYGYITDVTKLAGVPISGILGDQQAALVGQMCFNIGQAKSTYGTGCFILYNTGTSMVRSSHGLLTTVAYQLGPNKNPIYALEGSVAIAG